MDIGKTLSSVIDILGEVNKIHPLPEEVLTGLSIAASTAPIIPIGVAIVKGATKHPVPPNFSAGESSNAAQSQSITRVAKQRFNLGAASMKELSGVNAKLVAVVQRAIQLTGQDFCVYDGIRTVKEQAAAVARGDSKTMQSKHLDGLAVDLVPWINGKPVWDWTGCYKVAFAMDEAATEMGVANHIRWGGAWDRTLADFGTDLGSYEQEVKLYQSRHPGPDFLDGPHFEWVS